MGQIKVYFCDCCGLETQMLTAYTQVTDFEARTTDWDRSKNALELCDACLEKSKKNFQNMRKHTKPRTESDADCDAKA